MYFRVRLAMLALMLFVAVVAATVLIPSALIGGLPGWGAGIALGCAVGHLMRLPVGIVVGRLVDGRR